MAHGLGGVQGGEHVLHIVAVDLYHLPAESAPLVSQGLHRHDVIDPAVDLDAVAVHDGHQVLQVVVAGCHGGLPDHALLDLTVTQHDVGHVVLVMQLAGQGHAHAHGQAVAQGAGGHVHAGGLVHVRMALEDGVVLTQGVQLLGVKVAPAGQCRIEHRAGVAFGEDEAVPVSPAGVLGIDIQHVEVQGGHHLHRGERAAGVSSLGGVDHGDDVLSDLDGLLFQPFHIPLGEVVVVHHRSILSTSVFVLPGSQPFAGGLFPSSPIDYLRRRKKSNSCL